MSDWKTCSELIEVLQDEDEGLFMLQATLRDYPLDTPVRFFMDDRVCGVEFENGKKLTMRLYSSIWDELLEDDLSGIG